ncbi:MAG: hypothetical protein D6766_12085 [Verrucomicrobia bacterium]|nr:MAG: hypothetical protein D6766_12085 [Verrucomicrobiota bacterium]
MAGWMALAGAALLAGCSRSEQPAGNKESPAGANALAPGEQTAGSKPSSGTDANPQAQRVVEAAKAIFGDQARNLLPSQPAVPTTGSNAPMAARVLGELAKGKDADWAGALKEVGARAASEWLGKLGGETGRKLEALRQAVAGNTEAAAKVEAAARALLGDRDQEALALYSELKKVGLTPEQERLAAEARNLVGAFLAGKRLEGLENEQGQVRLLVERLRSGDFAGVVPVARELLQSAAPSPQQKDFIRTLVKQLTADLDGLPKTAPAAPPALPPVPGGG